MKEGNLFLGEPFDYWFELQAKARDLNVVSLIKELAEANAKVRYYERMLDQINLYRNIVTKP